MLVHQHKGQIMRNRLFALLIMISFVNLLTGISDIQAQSTETCNYVPITPETIGNLEPINSFQIQDERVLSYFVSLLMIDSAETSSTTLEAEIRGGYYDSAVRQLNIRHNENIVQNIRSTGLFQISADGTIIMSSLHTSVGLWHIELNFWYYLGLIVILCLITLISMLTMKNVRIWQYILASFSLAILIYSNMFLGAILWFIVVISIVFLKLRPSFIRIKLFYNFLGLISTIFLLLLACNISLVAYMGTSPQNEYDVQGLVTSLQLSNDNDLLLIGSSRWNNPDDTYFTAWNVQTSDLLLISETHEAIVTDIFWYSDYLIVSLDSEMNIVFWGSKSSSCP